MFQTIIYKNHAIQISNFNDGEQIKVLFALTAGSRYAYKYFKSIRGAKRAITKFINK